MPYNQLLLGRLPSAHVSYALTFCSASRKPLFTSKGSATEVVNAMNQSEREGYCTQLAFVVMPDHVHWLVTLTGKSSLAALVAATKGTATRRLQQRYGIALPIWQRGYYEHRVRNDEDLRLQARYLVANPVRAGLVKRAADFPYWFALWAPPPHGPSEFVDGVERILDAW